MGSRPASKEPQPITYRDYPKKLGGGRVCLYDARGGLPELLDTPLPKLIESMPWVLVHFPSRRHVLVKSKKVGLDYLREIKEGKDLTGIVPKKSDATIPKPAKSKPEPPARARAIKVDDKNSDKSSDKTAGKQAAPDDSAKEKPEFTAVPEGATFDQAMQHVFSPQRLTSELERLISFRKTIFTKDGDEIGEEDEPFVQLTALKTIISYHQGRPAEKLPPPPEKKRISYEELEALVLNDDDGLEYMAELVERGRKLRLKAKAATNAKGKAK